MRTWSDALSVTKACGSSGTSESNFHKLRQPPVLVSHSRMESHIAAVASEGMKAGASACVPQLHYAIPAACGEQPSILTQRHSNNLIGIPQSVKAVAGLRVPQAGGLVHAA
eukprot:scaffold264158_cov33-Prasinocladus_malaysianus.AAC.4